MSENNDRKPNILLAEDSLISTRAIQEALEDDFNLVSVKSGEECLTIVHSYIPEVILLDVNMEGMNGYDTCRKLKADAVTKNIPVVFISGDGGLKARLAGYEAGAHDFIIKPYCSDELLAKLRLLLGNVKHEHKLHQELEAARSTTMLVMSNSGEQGEILKFTQRAFECQTYKELGKAILETMDVFGLYGVVQIRDGTRTINIRSTGTAKPLEVSLLEQLKDEGRLYDFGCRTVINYQYTSLLIRNMPIADEDRYGRMKDHLAMLMNCANARVIPIGMEENALSSKMKLKSLLTRSQSILNNINNVFSKKDEASKKIVCDLTKDIELGLARLGLDDDQEAYFLKLLDNSAEELFHMGRHSEIVNQLFAEIMRELSKIADEIIVTH